MGKLSMCKQCVPDSFFSTHTRQLGNEASIYNNTNTNDDDKVEIVVTPQDAK